MADVVALASGFVDALERGDVAALRQVVPEKYWDWLDDYLRDPAGWPKVDALTGATRQVTGSRVVTTNSARLTLAGPLGHAFVTARFDTDEKLLGFAFDAEEYEGVGTIVITCPDERTAELREFYGLLTRDNPRRRPRLHFDEGYRYTPPRWPDPNYPQQMHLDFWVDDLDAAQARVTALGATALAQEHTHRTFADPIGHPFCLYPSDRTGLRRVVIDCPVPAALSAFYASLLGPAPVPELSFQQVSPYVAPRWPDPEFPAQMHFDIKVDDRTDIVPRIEAAGAVALPSQGGSCPVFADPAGHPFCLCLHGE